jgi:hypothetical protein
MMSATAFLTGTSPLLLTGASPLLLTGNEPVDGLEGDIRKLKAKR